MGVNAIPTLYVHRYIGSTVQVFQLVNGLTLGPQVGNDITPTASESATASENRHANRVVEAFGNIFLLVSDEIYRFNSGTNNWDVVHTLSPMAYTGSKSGLHSVVVNGRTQIVLMWADRNGAFGIYKTQTADGTNWSDTTLVAAGGNNIIDVGPSAIIGTSLWWWATKGSTFRLIRHDFATNATVTYFNPSSGLWGDDVARNMICGAREGVHLMEGTSNGIPYFLSGSNFIARSGGAAFGIGQAWPAGMFPHTVLYLPHGGSTGGPFVDDEIVTGSTSGAMGRIINLGVDPGDGWIQIDEVNDTFVEGETITGGISGATAVINAPQIEDLPVYWNCGQSGSISGYVSWSPRISTGYAGSPLGGLGQIGQPYGFACSFRSQEPNPLDQRTYIWMRSGSNYTGAVAFQLYRLDHMGSNWVSLGTTSFLANEYGLPHSFDGGAERVYTGSIAAAPEWGTRATNLSHGAVSGVGVFSIGEVLTGGTSGATGVVVEAFAGQTKVVNETGTFVNGEVVTGGTSTETATLSAAPDEDATFPPKEVSGGLRRRYFRVYGDGTDGALTYNLFFSGPDNVPVGGGGAELSGSLALKRATIDAVGVAAGSPSTSPSVSANQITNLTADNGATLYYVDADSVSDGLVPGQPHRVILDPV